MIPHLTIREYWRYKYHGDVRLPFAAAGSQQWQAKLITCTFYMVASCIHNKHNIAGL